MYVKVAFWEKMLCFVFPKDGCVLATRCKLELVHSDVCGPMQTLSFGNHSYFLNFIGHWSRFAWLYSLKAKSKVFMCFQMCVDG